MKAIAQLVSVVAIAALSTFLSNTYADGQKVALVIANSQYQSINPLINPLTDAQALAERLLPLLRKLADEGNRLAQLRLSTLHEDGEVVTQDMVQAAEGDEDARKNLARLGVSEQ